MHLVFCMAGRYRRFADAGYTTPKFLLPWRGSTVLDHVLGSMVHDPALSGVWLVANSRNRDHTAQLQAIMAGHGLPVDHLVFVDDTRGQAETALLGAQAVARAGDGGERRIAFHNVDTILTGRDFGRIAASLVDHDGWLDTFLADSPAFSYVAVDAQGRANDVVEKRVVSPYATTGLYAFADHERYGREAAALDPSEGELYISNVYRRMLADGARLDYAVEGPDMTTTILGTPTEYEAARTVP